MAGTRRRFLAWAAGALALLAAAPGALRAQAQARAIHRATRNTVAGAIGVRVRRLFGRPRPSKPYEGRSRIELPAARTTPHLALEEVLTRYAPAPGFSEAALPKPVLTRLLHAANGVTGSGPGDLKLRAAPSAGALYAGEVYVAAERVDGLEPGLYAYAPLEGDPGRGRLVALRQGPQLERVAAALEAPARARGAAAAVLLTNVFHRYRYRYANRGYRYALIDSGHIGENLRLSATSAGLAEWGPLRFHDGALNELLGVDGVQEAVCALHLVGAPGTAPEEGAVRRLVPAPRADAALPDAADDAPERYHALSRLVPAPEGKAGTPPAAGEAEAVEGAGAAGTEEPSANGATPGPDGEESEEGPLPERPAPGGRLEARIAARRSARRFRDAPIAAGDLGFALAAAAGHPALRRAPGVALYVFVHRAEGVAAGLYAARPEARALRRLQAGSLASELVEVCLGQEKAGSAAVAFAMVADLAGATARGGDRAYRDLLLEAGGVGQRLYLAAEATGLAARNLAAYLDDRMNALCGLDGRRRPVVHLTLLGPGD